MDHSKAQRTLASQLTTVTNYGLVMMSPEMFLKLTYL